MRRKRRKLIPEFWCYIEGWRAVGNVKIGRKWVRYTVIGDLSSGRMSLSSWKSDKKHPIVYVRGQGYKVQWDQHSR